MIADVSQKLQLAAALRFLTNETVAQTHIFTQLCIDK